MLCNYRLVDISNRFVFRPFPFSEKEMGIFFLTVSDFSVYSQGFDKRYVNTFLIDPETYWLKVPGGTQQVVSKTRLALSPCLDKVGSRRENPR